MSKGKRTLKVLHGKDYHQMSSPELRELLAKLKIDQMSIRARNCAEGTAGAQPVPHPSGQSRENRKAIARIMTVLISRGERCV